MVLKPATPLAILLLTAFVLLLLSVLSTPVVKSIPIATFKGVDYGVFGYCKGPECSGFTLGYTPDGAFGDPSDDSDFNLPSNIRHSLTSLLIVHPVAALLTLICFGLAAAAHLHSPSHSPRYLLGLLILLLPTLLVSLLAFLVDILLFVPHLQWGGWLVLAATILLTSSGVVTCAMRRTLVSRKARKRRIAENAEMSGENFYNRQNSEKLDPAPTPSEIKETTITESSTAGSAPAFAAFESSHPGDDENRPLNSRSPPTLGSPAREYDSRVDPYNPERGGYNGPSSHPPPRPMRHGPMDPRLMNNNPNRNMGSRRGGMPGFPPRGRSGPSRRGRGAPYAGGRGRGGPSGYPPMDRGFPAGGYGPRYGGPGIPEDYANGSNRPIPRNGNGMRGPPPVGDYGQQMGQDIEMETSPVNSYPAPNVPQGDIPAGMTGLQPGVPHIGRIQSQSSVYSRPDAYTTPRGEWAKHEPTLPDIQPEDPSLTRQSPSPLGPSTQPRDMTRSPRHVRSNSASNYYEDIDPRFVEPEAVNMPPVLASAPPDDPEPRTSFDDLPEGARSPATSEVSHYTSISQRGINPKWRPPEAEKQAKVQKRQDVLLGNNPDFEIPSSRGRGHTGPGSRMPPLPKMPGMPSSIPIPGGDVGGARYP